MGAELGLALRHLFKVDVYIADTFVSGLLVCGEILLILISAIHSCQQPRHLNIREQVDSHPRKSSAIHVKLKVARVQVNNRTSRG